MEKTLTNEIGPQQWLEDQEASQQLHNQLEAESGLEKHIEKESVEQDQSQSRKRSSTRNSLHSVKTPIGKRKTSTSHGDKSVSPKSIKESKEKPQNDN